MKKTLRIMLCLAVILSMAIPAFAAPEEGKLVTVAQVDEGQKVWGAGINYTRIIELQHSGEHNGTLLATYEYATSGLRHEKPGYNIHRSTDGGSTWEMIAVVREKAANLQSEWMPHLFELPCQIGSMPAGTLLLAACSIDHTHTQQNALRIYRSFDQGETWEQYSNIISIRGGVGYWEPFLMVLPDGRLAVYYSDISEGEAHSQKLVMKISSDGINWGETIDVVALEDRVMRPGMSIVAQMNDGRYVMVYEMCEEDDPDCGNAIHYRFSEDGINWGDPADPGIKIVSDKGKVPGSAPYIINVPGYGENGLLIVTAVFASPQESRGNVVYLNDQLGDPDAWRTWYLPTNYRSKDAGGYSHAMFTAMDGKTAYFVNNIRDDQRENGEFKMVFSWVTFDEDVFEK